MTAQEQGLAILVSAARQIVPPQLDFVVIVFRPDGPIRMSSAMYQSPGKTPKEQYERAKEAARAFLTEPPHPSFNPQG
jgi:hypothetical protein